ncbi:antitoxin Xre/MbcA/ParS toxin-binding domain-containing protein [Marinobacter alexandrii]|uniref:antitoxin Xre/MbcA/ParS toxin-binding domain-containing protein n=1 Tax=Marinobacter alexandrii TaxID=2570351 RepID=UPI003984161A
MFHGDQDETNRWLDSPCLGLGHKTPNKCLETREGIDQVRTLVGRLQHGIIT